MEDNWKIPCANCGCKQQIMKLCTACKQEFYCSRNCQANHWLFHKPICQSSKIKGAGQHHCHPAAPYNPASVKYSQTGNQVAENSACGCNSQLCQELNTRDTDTAGIGHREVNCEPNLTVSDHDGIGLASGLNSQSSKESSSAKDSGGIVSCEVNHDSSLTLGRHYGSGSARDSNSQLSKESPTVKDTAGIGSNEVNFVSDLTLHNHLRIGSDKSDSCNYDGKYFPPTSIPDEPKDHALQRNNKCSTKAMCDCRDLIGSCVSQNVSKMVQTVNCNLEDTTATVIIKHNKKRHELPVSTTASGNLFLTTVSNFLHIPLSNLKLIHKGKLVTGSNAKDMVFDKALFLAFGEVSESEEGLVRTDIDLIVRQLNIERNVAVRALRKTGSVVDAIFEIGNNT